MRIGIYNHQHLRGGCPVCSQTYVKGMIADGSNALWNVDGANVATNLVRVVGVGRSTRIAGK